MVGDCMGKGVRELGKGVRELRCTPCTTLLSAAL